MHQRLKYVQVSFLSTFCHFSQQQKRTGKLFYERDDNGAFLFVCLLGGVLFCHCFLCVCLCVCLCVFVVVVVVCVFLCVCVWVFCCCCCFGEGSAFAELIVLSDDHITRVPIPLTSVCTMRTLSRRKL